jgi:hypothetical protein
MCGVELLMRSKHSALHLEARFEGTRFMPCACKYTANDEYTIWLIIIIIRIHSGDLKRREIHLAAPNPRRAQEAQPRCMHALCFIVRATINRRRCDCNLYQGQCSMSYCSHNVQF